MREEILDLLGRDPFVPFTLVMNRGDRYTVQFPGLAALGTSLMYIMRANSDRRDVLRLTEICSVEVLDPI